MSDNKLVIDADTRKLRKSLLDISKDLKDLGKSKIAIFDKNEREYLKAGAKVALDNIRKQMQINKKELEAALKVQAKTNKSVYEEYNNRKKIHDILKKQVDLQKELGKAQDIAESAKGPATGIRGFLGRSKGRIGQAASALGLGGAMRFLGPAGMAMAAGGFLYSRGRNAYNTFSGGINDRIGLRGRQVGDMELSDPNRATNAGLNAQSMRRARLASMDVFGRAGSTQKAVMQRAEFERNFGIEQGTMTGIGAQMRGTLGGRGADKATMTIQAGLIASGITDEIGPFLETAANMLTEINERGISFSDSAMALLSTVAGSGEIAPERAGRMIANIDEAIRGSSGEANAFFQQIFKGAGVGGQSIGGIQAGIRTGGLFGANLNDMYLSDTDKKAFETLGIGGRNMGNIARSTMKNLDTLFGSDQDIDKMLSNPETSNAGAQRRMQRNNFIMQTFGLRSEGQAAEVNKLLSEAANPETSAKKQADIQKKIKNMQAGNTELGNLQKINESTAAMVDILQNKKINVQDEMGAKLAPLFTSLDSVMMKIDASLVAILDFFGIQTASEKIQGSLSGQDLMNANDFEAATMGNKQKAEEFSKIMAEEFTKKQKRLDELNAKDTLTGAENFEKGRLSRELRNMEMSDTAIPGLNMGQFMSKDENLKLNQQTINRLKQEQAVANANPMAAMGDLLDGIKNLFSSEPGKPEKQDTKVFEEMINQQKRNVRATDKSTRAIKSSGGLAIGTGRT